MTKPSTIKKKKKEDKAEKKKKELIMILLKLFQETEEEKMLPESLYGATITPIPKLAKMLPKMKIIGQYLSLK